LCIADAGEVGAAMWIDETQAKVVATGTIKTSEIKKKTVVIFNQLMLIL